MQTTVCALVMALLSQPDWAQAGSNVDELGKELSNPDAAIMTGDFKLENHTFDAATRVAVLARTR